VQSLVSLALAADAPSGQWLEHRHEHHDFMRKICATFPRVDADGFCALPDGPGIGRRSTRVF
jgi:L-alanine-DL-glutamate epimerase-like enolase superfamily enzyme